MAQKDKDSLELNIEKFNSYFKEDLDAIEEELEKSKEYSSIIDTEINKLSGPSLGTNRGAQSYLIEHITNAVALQTQRQGLRKDRFAIKKAIMDYASKFADEKTVGDESVSLIDKINELLENDKKNKEDSTKTINQPDNLDDEIDNLLGGN